MKFKNIFKWFLYLILTALLGLFLLVSFYVWMIYGIHPSDEGSTGLACEYSQEQVTRAELTMIKDSKRVVVSRDPSFCKKYNKESTVK